MQTSKNIFIYFPGVTKKFLLKFLNIKYSEVRDPRPSVHCTIQILTASTTQVTVKSGSFQEPGRHLTRALSNSPHPFLPIVACSFYMGTTRKLGAQFKLLRTAARWLCSRRESSPTIYSEPLPSPSSALFSNFLTLLTLNRIPHYASLNSIHFTTI